MSQLCLEKRDLENVPRFAVPEGYALRTYREGDAAAMAEVYAASGLGTETPEAVRANILDHPCFQPERLFVAEYQGAPVGTAAAWIDESQPGAGYLHMVGVLPEHRGKRLGLLLCAAAIDYTRAEGFTRQWLKTDDWREDAIRLYLDMGFYPVYTEDTHLGRWQMIAEKLGRPRVLACARDRR